MRFPDCIKRTVKGEDPRAAWVPGGVGSGYGAAAGAGPPVSARGLPSAPPWGLC